MKYINVVLTLTSLLMFCVTSGSVVAKDFKGTITETGVVDEDCPGGRGYMGEVKIYYLLGTYMGEPIYKYGFFWDWYDQENLVVDQEHSIHLSDLKKYPNLYERFITMQPINLYFTADIYFYSGSVCIGTAELPIKYHQLPIGKAGKSQGDLIPGSPNWKDFFKIKNSSKSYSDNKSLFMAADRIEFKNLKVSRIEWARVDGIVDDYLRKEKAEEEKKALEDRKQTEKKVLEKKVAIEKAEVEKKKLSRTEKQKENLQSAENKQSNNEVSVKQKNSFSVPLVKDTPKEKADTNTEVVQNKKIDQEVNSEREKTEKKIIEEKTETPKNAKEEKLLDEKTKSTKESIQKENFTISLDIGVNLEMIWIKPGTFTMGSPIGEVGRYDNETQHQVTLTKGYWLGKYEVTQEQYKSVMGSNPSKFAGSNLPVEQVSWKEAKEFCKKLTAQENAAGRLPKGYEYNLPSEAQWEYACRAGTTTAINSGKNLTDTLRCANMDEVGWNFYNSDDKTYPVGQKKPNAWGLYDMHGNVKEWCLDWYEDYSSDSVTDPSGPRTGTACILRGGSWADQSPMYCRSARRSGFSPDGRKGSVGFRLALVPVQ